jgi:hypothetical protein
MLRTISALFINRIRESNNKGGQLMIGLFSALEKFSRDYRCVTSKIFLIPLLLLALLYSNPTSVFSQIEWIKHPNPVLSPV